jgi:hypothetical protein
MGPKTSGNTGGDFQKKVDRLFKLNDEAEVDEPEKEEADAGDKSSEDG